MRPPVERSYRWLFWCLALVGFALDQGSKYGVFHSLYPEKDRDIVKYDTVKYELIAGAFALETQFLPEWDGGQGLLSPLRTWGGDRLPYVNKGALFGLRVFRLEESSNELFALVSVAAAVAILAWSMRPSTTRDGFLSVALGLILAGTLGNLYDRVVFGGVRDFLHWNKWVDWPVFNLADCCLVCGACLLLVQAFCTQQAGDTEQQTATALAGMPEVAEAK